MTRTRVTVAAVVAAVLLGSVIAFAVSRASHPGPTAQGSSSSAGSTSRGGDGSASSPSEGGASSSPSSSTSSSPKASPRAGQPTTSSSSGGHPTSAGIPTAAPTPHPISTSSSLPLPIRAAFYYPWFPQTWGSPPNNAYTHYHPTLGYYSSADQATVQKHVAAMQYGHLQAGIASWWGQGSDTDANIPLLLSVARGAGFKWALYYEAEGNQVPGVAGSPNPTVPQITSDLSYIKTRYAGDPGYLHVNGKPVVFVYGDPSDSCATADRWKQANTLGFYVQLKVFSGYQGCASQPDGWHQYGPDSASDSQSGYSFTISPGFWKAGEQTPRLARDPATFSRNAQTMVASGAPWQLVTTFNEWGEGTAVESASEWASASGYGTYLDTLHNY
ncbi:MAG TPA: hypothetical protein VG266_09585 [Candidatus Dormibacteraeota bacterium]|nr:hypothetical protein [Candidatus Dormibacteraeota bacterium]